MSAQGEDILAWLDAAIGEYEQAALLSVDWQFTQQWPGDETQTGYVPRIDEHVLCYRPSDGKTFCGTVDDNRCGLFLTTCLHGRVALTASLWTVQPLERSATCPGGTQTPPTEGDQVT